MEIGHPGVYIEIFVYGRHPTKPLSISGQESVGPVKNPFYPD
jgi:hypothetical protein